MFVTDFTYDGASLSSKGYMVCDFGSSGDTAEGSQLTFNTVPINKGQLFLLADTKYEQCLTTTFCICKNPCHVAAQENLKLTPSEVSTLSRWLNKKTFRSLTFSGTEWANINFEASFNIKVMEIGGETYGLELEMITNRPFATKTAVTQTLTFTSDALTKTFTDTSDEIGYVYPTSFTITPTGAGNISITNAMENRTTTIKNCAANETITITYPTIASSVGTHNLSEDFNYVFPRIANTSANSVNSFTASAPCTVVFTYKPIIKVAL